MSVNLSVQPQPCFLCCLEEKLFRFLTQGVMSILAGVTTLFECHETFSSVRAWGRARDLNFIRKGLNGSIAIQACLFCRRGGGRATEDVSC